MLAIKRILRYLKGTIIHGLSLQSASSLDLQGYSDVDWTYFPDDRHITFGFCVFLSPNLIPWSSAKQKSVSKSPIEYEYKSLTAEIVWIQSLLGELCLPTSIPTIM